MTTIPVQDVAPFLEYRVINANSLQWLYENYTGNEQYDCIFADPPDGIGLGYNEFNDKTPDREYRDFLHDCLREFVRHSPIVWFSFNAKWTAAFGYIADQFLQTTRGKDWEMKPCVQTFTFGQHRNTDLGNNHRPLWRFKHRDALLYPHHVKVPSWRQLNGDPRAKEGGRVPGDVFDFPRVTGNSKQRRRWHPTQLNEGLVDRAISLSTCVGDKVLDPFAGTGTTLRVCKQIGRACTVIDMDTKYCRKIAEENSVPKVEENLMPVS